MHKTLTPWRRRMARCAAMVAACAALAVGAGWWLLSGSLPQLDGEVPVSELAAEVAISRDAVGGVQIRGAARSDVAYATGFVHAQDRFFQMDLLRRTAAGELAALVGEAGVALDRQARLHKFRERARDALATLPAGQRALLTRYTDGVNEGLRLLRCRPFEYFVLRSLPDPWRAEDSLLVVWAMYMDLQGHQLSRELARGWLREHASAEQLAFLLPAASAEDAPLDAPNIGLPVGTAPASAPAWFSQSSAPTRSAAVAARFVPALGSNSGALTGSRTVDGRAVVFNDVHLRLSLPNIWYRVALEWHDAGAARRVVGVSLPGAPPVVAGSNGHVAWGFTNGYVDALDLIELERDASDALRIRVAGRWERATQRVETIHVAHGKPVSLTVLDSSAGPVIEVGGKAFAVRWVAHEPGAVDLGLLELERSQRLADAQDVAAKAGVPAQNMIAADRSGAIGWTIAGALPRRGVDAADPSFPLNSSWDGLLPSQEHPVVDKPAQGQLWSANSRALAGPEHRKLGDGGAVLGARARQLRDGLAALERALEKDVYGITLDDRALFMQAWRQRALRVLDAKAIEGHPQRAEFRRLLEQAWNGRADPASVGFRLARAYWLALYDEVFGSLDSVLARQPVPASFELANPRWPVVLAALVDDRPAGWLSQGRTWREVELSAIDLAILRMTQNGARLDQARWGVRNRAAIAHPLAASLPVVGAWLTAPQDELAGDDHMPRVAAPAFGASERLVVSPGHEQDALFNMPGGQSGHPLSPYFLAGHADWVQGQPQPLLPGPAIHVLTLRPR